MPTREIAPDQTQSEKLPLSFHSWGWCQSGDSFSARDWAGILEMLPPSRLKLPMSTRTNSKQVSQLWQPRRQPWTLQNPALLTFTKSWQGALKGLMKIFSIFESRATFPLRNRTATQLKAEVKLLASRTLSSTAAARIFRHENVWVLTLSNCKQLQSAWEAVVGLISIQ